MAATTIQKHYARLLRLWPTDLLRPTTFHRATLLRLSPSFSSPSSHTTPSATPSQPTGPLTLAPHISKSPAVPPPASQSGTQGSLGAATQEAQINALYSLLENRYSKTYPTSPEMLRPRSKPEYYEELAREMEEAPRRTRWQRWGLRLRGLIRLS